jgi:hypothetical protein
MAALSDLPGVYREKAVLLERYSPAAAEAFREAAELAERALTESQLEALDLHAASRESGYTVPHLRRMLRDGTVPDAGGGTILRRDLPRKPGRLRPPDADLGSRLQVARGVLSQGG